MARGRARSLKEAGGQSASFAILKTMIIVNGLEVDAAGKTVAEYLSSSNFDLKRIAVERNGDIVPKAKYAETVLADGDNLEVVNFVGGG